jgi:cephalosporin-C deacetylase
MTALDVYDIHFSGFGGEHVSAWLRVPSGTTGPRPTIVEFVGYGGGRGLAEDSLFWASCGFAHLHVDARGQGAGWSVGDTPDQAPSGPRGSGVMTAGIEDRHNYYYRRIITDSVMALDAAAQMPLVDESRLTVLGTSQGGGLALAVAGLSPQVATLVAYVPFLCDFPRATTITDATPYREISKYLAVHRDREAQVMHTLRYFDGVNFAKRASAPAFFTAALMDDVCPPSTIVGAYNAYAGPKQLRVWRHNGHEGGGRHDDREIALGLRAHGNKFLAHTM